MLGNHYNDAIQHRAVVIHHETFDVATYAIHRSKGEFGLLYKIRFRFWFRFTKRRPKFHDVLNQDFNDIRC